jgi:hypothetical protein
LGLELAGTVGLGSLIASGHQLGPDRFGQPPDVPTADWDVGQQPERLGGHLEGGEYGSGVNDLG